MLPSGLPEQVSASESLARYAFQSSYIGTNPPRVKPRLFDPYLNTTKNLLETSISRIDGEAEVESHARGGNIATGLGKNYYGFGKFKAEAVKTARLAVDSDEPPDRHAIIVGWPDDADEELRKARLLSMRDTLAAESDLIIP